MKIRTDFVTNSSSSSFTLILSITMKDGNVISWEGTADDGEGGFDYVDLAATKSPRQLAHASSINELIQMLNTSIREGYWNSEENGTSLQVGRELANELLRYGVSDIKSIEITGNEENYESYNRTYIYDAEKDLYTLDQLGDEFEKNGGSGGDLYFEDEHLLSDGSADDSVTDYSSYLETLFPITVSVEKMDHDGKSDELSKISEGDILFLQADANSSYYDPVAVRVLNKEGALLGYLAERFFPDLEGIALLAEQEKIRAKVSSVASSSDKKSGELEVLLEICKNDTEVRNAASQTVSSNSITESYTDKAVQIIIVNDEFNKYLDLYEMKPKDDQAAIERIGNGLNITLYDQRYLEPVNSLEDNHQKIINILENNFSNGYDKDMLLNNTKELLDGYRIMSWAALTKTYDPSIPKEDDEQNVQEESVIFRSFHGGWQFCDKDNHLITGSYGKSRYKITFFVKDPDNWADLSGIDFFKYGFEIDLLSLMQNRKDKYEAADGLFITEEDFLSFAKQIIDCGKNVFFVALKLCAAIEWYENFGIKVYGYFGDTLEERVSGYDFNDVENDDPIEELGQITDLKEAVKQWFDLSSLSDQSKSNLKEFGVDSDLLGSELISENKQVLEELSNSMSDLSKTLDELLGMFEDQQDEDDL